jgi:hypothetical protein
MAMKYLNIFQSKTLPNFIKLVVLVWKTNHLATLLGRYEKKLKQKDLSMST